LYSDDEQFWIGTYQGLNVMHRADQNIKKLSFDQSSYNRNLPIRAFVISQSGSKNDKEGWFLEGSKLKKFWLTDSGLIANENGLSEINKKDYHNIDIDSKQRLWLFSSRGLHFLKDNILFTPSSTDQNNIYYQMVDDQHGKVWFTSLDGLYYYHEDSGKILKDTSVMMTIENKFGNRYLSSIVINSKNDKLMVFKGGSLGNQQLVFQFNNKLSILNKKDHNKLNNLENLEGAIFINDTTFIVYSTNGALLGKSVDGFIKIIDDHQFDKSLGLANLRNATKDRQGKIWFSTDFGICSFDFEKYGLRSYNYYNSKISTFIHPDIKVSPNTYKLYSADFNGLLQCPNEEFVSTSPPCLTELSINNFNNYERLDKKDKLKLKYYQNTLSFSFSNFDFYNPDVHEYEFKLNENSWQTFQNGKLRFEKLSDGNYDLSVRVRNSKGIMHSEYFNLKFEIRPPFYKTIWFNIFLLSLGFVILYSFFKYKEIQRQKLIDLRYNIARDLHDDLGSNLSNIKLISEREALKYKNAQFSSIADQMRKAMISMSEIVWSINPQNDRIEDVLLKIQEYMINVCEHQNINLCFEIEDLQIKRNMNPDDKRNLLLIFKEALNNVIKYSDANQVTFSAKQKSKNIYLSIKDNGKGFNFEKVKLGNGIKNMESRAMALDGKININSSSEGTLIELFL
jgi:two-component sensor histidine kinase